jgi:hypothetical protein
MKICGLGAMSIGSGCDHNSRQSGPRSRFNALTSLTVDRAAVRELAQELAGGPAGCRSVWWR